MKKCSLFTFLICSSVFTVSLSQSKLTLLQNDLQKLGLEEKVKSMKENEYKVEDKFGQIAKIKKERFEEDKTKSWRDTTFTERKDLNDKGIFAWECDKSYLFDANKNKTEESWYNAEGERVSKWIYKYDDKGNMVEEGLYNSDGSLFNKRVYKYDDKSLLIEKNRYYSDGSLYHKRIYNYSESGKLMGEILYDLNGKIIKKKNYKYDGEKLIEENIYYSITPCNYNYPVLHEELRNAIKQGRVKADTTLFVTDEKSFMEKMKSCEDGNDKILVRNKNGTVKEVHIYDWDGKLIWLINLYYNGKFSPSRASGEDVLLGKIKTNLYTGKTEYTNKIEYKYDDKGNQIEKTVYYSDESLDTKYEFKYDNNGRIIDEPHYYFSPKLSDKYELMYDTNGRIVTEPKLSQKYIYDYDDRGNKKEKTYKYFFPDRKEDPDRYTNHWGYNDKNQCVEYSSHSRYGKNEWDNSTTYKYNDQGKIIEENAVSSKKIFNEEKNNYDTSDNTITTKYEYDNRGNWIKKITYENGILLKHMIEREIEYFLE